MAVGRLAQQRWIRLVCGIVVEFFRAVPVLLMMYFAYNIYSRNGVFLPTLNPLMAVVTALTLYNGSVIAETIRAGVEALPKGQAEAGYSIGLRKNGVMRLILLPQAIRAMLPVLVAQLVVTMKDTALGFIITYPELLYLAKLMSSSPGRPLLQSAFVIGGIYIVLCIILSACASLVERRMRQSHARVTAGGADEPDPRQHDRPVTEVLAVQYLEDERDRDRS